MALEGIGRVALRSQYDPYFVSLGVHLYPVGAAFSRDIISQQDAAPTRVKTVLS